MNPWLLRIRQPTPYRASVFRVTRVAREEIRHRAIVARIGQTRQMLRSSQSHVVDGVPVTEAELNAAEKVVMNETHRVIAELIEHPAERPPAREFEALAAEAAKVMADPDPAPLVPVRLDLPGRQLAAELANELACAALRGTALFGALECEMIPPFIAIKE